MSDARNRQDAVTGSERRGPGQWAVAMEWSLRGVCHLVMGGIVAAGMLAFMFNPGSLQVLASSSVGGGGYRPDWMGLIGLYAGGLSLWLMAWCGVRYAWEAFSQRATGDGQQGVAGAGRGAVMTETLIVLVPFMLLTSGIAQITMNQSASIMAHYAAYQAARTHWVWHDEPDSLRGQSGFGDTATQSRIRQRSQLAAALVLAPSAPADFEVTSSSNQYLQNMQGIMKASFVDNVSATGDTVAGMLGSGPSVSGEGRNLSFSRALGGSPFPQRAARKLGFTFTALNEGNNFELIHGGGGNVAAVGARFEYPLQQAFPWFAFIHSGSSSGCAQEVAGRSGCYITLTREAKLNEQVGVYSTK